MVSIRLRADGYRLLRFNQEGGACYTELTATKEVTWGVFQRVCSRLCCEESCTAPGRWDQDWPNWASDSDAIERQMM